VPRFASDWELDAPGRRWQEVDGTLCFVDISGFTNLSERLAGRGRIGAEELTEVLSRAFGAMLDLAYERGGALVKFGGDALLFLFTGDQHAVQASCAAVEMRGALRESRQWRTSVGRLDLGMSIGIHSGTVHLFHVGNSHRELIITGPAATTTTQMEKGADKGEIVVSAATHAALPGVPVAPKGEGWLLPWRRVRAPTVGPVTRRAGTGSAIDTNLSVALREHLSAGSAEPEHRIATVGFIRFEGVDALLRFEGPDAVADGLEALVVATQEAADREDVTFLASDIDANGGKIILVAGVPVGRTDDEGRLVRTVRAIADVRLPFTIRIGVNRGHVFAGEVGTKHRATYTVMGDTVNLGARLMASAGPGEIYATRTVLDLSRTLFETCALEPFHVKGKVEAVQAYAVGARGEDRAEEVRTDLPFTGRTRELAEIVDVLGADRSTGTTLVVVGEKGIGKSRLIEEALRMSHDTPRLLVRAEAYRMTTPYYAFRAPMHELLAVRPDAPNIADDVRSTVRRLAPDHVHLTPLLSDLINVDLDPTPQTSAIEPRFRPARLADLVTQLLRGHFPSKAVFVVEDAHWLDDASVGLVRHLEGVMADMPWVLLVSRRDEQGGYVETDAQTIRLGPLDDSSTHALVVDATEGAPLRPHTVEAIVERTGGNPLFVEELLRALQTSGDDANLPESLDDVVGAQIDALAPIARRLLQFASVLGRTFPRWLLEDVVAEGRMQLDDATARSLEVFLIPEGSDLRFRHAVVRDAAYERLSFKRRRDIHLRAAVAVEGRAGDDADAAADVLGLHFALGGEAARAWRYARIAGDRARNAYANIEAAVHYERALEAARQEADVPDADRAAVWTSLGEVQHLAGLYRDALESFARAMSLEAATTRRAELRLKRAQVLQRTGAFRTALREASAGSSLVAAERSDVAASLRIQLLAFRAFVRQAQQRPLDALRQAQQVAVAAKEIDDQRALAGAYTVLDWAHLMLGRPSDATLLPQALAIYEQLGDLTSQASTLNNLGGRAFYAGEWAEAAELYQRARTVYLRSGDVVRAATAGANAGEILVAQGRMDEAADVLRSSARTLRAAGRTEEAAFAEAHLARTIAAVGDLAEAEQLLCGTLAELQGLGAPMIALITAVHLADVIRMKGDPTRALDVLGGAESAAGAEAAILAPSTANVRALILADLGRLDEAARVVDEGIGVAEQQALVYERAQLVLTQALLLERAESETDAGRVGSALADLRRLGVPTRPEDRDA
jgi:class 3 adenylate cyclase/tetratricopeptide (TPR) repeat protein